MVIVSQDRESIIPFTNCIVKYEACNGKHALIAYTQLISSPVKIAEYNTKDRCLEIICDICQRYGDECYTDTVFDYSSECNKNNVYQNNSVYKMPER